MSWIFAEPRIVAASPPHRSGPIAANQRIQRVITDIDTAPPAPSRTLQIDVLASELAGEISIT
jgi:hypothetical protein